MKRFAILNTRKYYRELSGDPTVAAQSPSPISSPIPASLPLPIPATLRKREPLQLKSAFCAFLIAAVTEGIGAYLYFYVGGTLEALTDSSGRSFTGAALTALGVYTVIAVSGLFFAGLISGFASPGRTVREAAIGICSATLVTTLLEPWHQAPIDLAIGVLLCTGLGTFGAWLGELLQPRRPAVSSTV
ncbi:MAG: hypothetical protein K2W95_27420 [Candidatus Obscuribacterales bacterium]|nr:hypothetical protein [Candidatus Obscuribacterales bacterium]